jgi:hypothetical protein
VKINLCNSKHYTLLRYATLRCTTSHSTSTHTAQRTTPHHHALHYIIQHSTSHYTISYYTTPQTSTPPHTTTHPSIPHHSINPATRPIRLSRPITAFARIKLSRDILVDSYLFGCCVTSVVYSYFSVYRYLISPHHPNKGTPVPVTVSQKLR